MNKKNIIYIIIALAVILGASYYFYQSQYSPSQTNQKPFVKPTSTPATMVSPKTEPGVTAVAAPQAKTYNIAIANFSFDPASLNIKKGDTVIWTNNDPMAHQIAGSDFSGPAMNKGQSYTFIFNNAGTFDYYCTIHPSMKGSITVQ